MTARDLAANDGAPIAAEAFAAVPELAPVVSIEGKRGRK